MAKIKKLVGLKNHKTNAPKDQAAKEAAPAQATETPVMDRRGSDRRKSTDRRQKDVPVAVERRKVERREKVSRRRQIDPTTCERDYRDDEIEFMNALDQYKRTSGRMFPTCSEILEVLRGLGYEKRPAVEPVVEPVADEPVAAVSALPVAPPSLA